MSAEVRSGVARALAYGKVNLALFLGPTRASDGRHELVTLLQAVTLADEVTITPWPHGRGAASTVTADEVICPGVEGPNIVADTLAALRHAGWNAPPVRVEIAKHVPVAAGMGGGSADAAAVLRLAPSIAPLPAAADLAAIAAGLGADVPAALTPGLVLGTGAGERVTPRPPLAPFELVIVPHGGPLSTPAVYREADRLGLGRPSAELAALAEALRAVPPNSPLPAELLVNDLEDATLSLMPEVAETLTAVRASGADHAFVCGSGPTVAGLFWGAPERADTAAARLRERYPRAQAAPPTKADFAALGSSA